MRGYQSRRRRALAEMRAGMGGQRVEARPLPLEPPFRPFSWEDPFDAPATWTASLATPGLAFLRIRPSPADEVRPPQGPQLLTSLPLAGPASFEIVGVGRERERRPRIALQLVLSQPPGATASALLAHFPLAEVFPAQDLLEEVGADPADAHVLGFRLAESHLFQLRAEHPSDPYATLFGVLAGLEGGHWGGLQVLWAPVANDWASNIKAVAEDPLAPGKSAFKDLPDLPQTAAKKIAFPLFAVSLRLFASSPDSLRRLVPFLGQYAGDNRLVAIPEALPSQCLMRRSNHTPGMILNARELAALVHMPAAELVGSLPVERAWPSAPPPAEARERALVTLGVNSHGGRVTRVGIGEEWLTRHCAVFGATGMGKTSLLLRFAELVDRGYGLAFIDPAGDAAQDLLDLIPKRRVTDVIYFNPTDRQYPPALNVLEASDEREKDMLCSDLLVAFRRYFADAWGHQQERLLRNCLMTLLASQGQRSLRDVARLLLDEEFRRTVVATVEDGDLRDFWELQLRYIGREAINPVLNKLSKFVDNPLIRCIIGQPNLIDFHRIVAEGQVFVANLSKGLLGEDSAGLLGAFILARLQQAAMARQSLRREERKLFTIVVDEFHNFANSRSETDSICSFFSEARKYGVAVVVATQFLHQLDQKVINAIFGNVGTLVVFRPGIDDAPHFRKELGRFRVEDLLNLEVMNALVRMGRACEAFNLAVERPRPGFSWAQEIIRHSRERYCRPREVVEEMLRRRGPELPARTAAGEPTELSRDARAFLAHLIDQPERTVTQVYRDLHLSAYKGNRIKNDLLAMGLVTEIAAPVGLRGRVAKFLVPAPLAYALVSRGRPRGKGGPLHRLLQRLVQERAARKGYQAAVEVPLPDGQVDVALRGPEGTVAFEIEVSRNHDQQLTNVRKCLAHGFTRVVILFLDAQEREASQVRIQEELLQDERARVSFCLVSELDEYL